MTLPERCQAGQAKLEAVSAALLDPRPEILNHCEAELQDVIGLLEATTSNAFARGNSESTSAERLADHPSGKSDLLRLRYRLRLLALQVQQATNLYQGWAQLGLSAGYTDQGKPVLHLSEPRSSYEV
jgi:hypothetical protein